MLPEPREIFFEITIIGLSAKVSAIDGETGIEVCVFGPARAASNELKRLAIAKLHTRLAAEASNFPE